MIIKVFNDIVGLIGFGLVGYGCYLVTPWLAYTVVGSCLVAYALVNGKRLDGNKG